VALNAGETFGPYPHCVRLNFATTPAILDQILDRMVAAVRRLRPSAAAQ
jgi:bifunctional pyridoxal-dependent enzyme with beta-cystathionase and maltose regulon repressor activities